MIAKQLLRTFTCAVWVVALLMTAVYGIAFSMADTGSDEQHFWMQKVLICGAIWLVGTFVHTKLICEDVKHEE